MAKAQELLKDVWNILILETAKQGKNLSDIQKEVNLTYSAIFKKVKDMEKAGIILIDHNNAGNKITISPKYLEDVNSAIEKFSYSENFLKSLPEKDLKKILEILNKKRFTTLEDFDFSIAQYLPHLEQVGIIRQRTEITKLGKKLLNDMNSKK